MYVMKSGYKGKTFLSIVEGYRINGKVRHKTIKRLGYLEDLKKEYDDPIAHFNIVAKELEQEYKSNKIITEHIINESLPVGDNHLNLGYFALKKIYTELGLDTFFKDFQNKYKCEYSFNDIFFLTTISRILLPNSKKATYENKDLFFEKNDFELHDIYRALDFFADLHKPIQKLLWDNSKELYNRDTSTSFYDCTNYYFEIDYNDEDTYDENGNLTKVRI